MARMSLDTAIRLSAEVKGANNIAKVQRSLQDLAKGSQTTARDVQTLRAATFQYARANDGTIAGIRNSITAFRGLQEQAKIGSREFTRYGSEIQKLEAKLKALDGTAKAAGRSLTLRDAAASAAGTVAMGGGPMAAIGAAGGTLAAAGGAAGIAAAGTLVLTGALTVQSVAAAKALEDQSRRLRVMTDDSAALQSGVTALVREQGYLASTTEATAAAYDILQAGFAGTDDILKIVKASTLGAAGGFADLVTVSDALTSILNGYNRTAGDAGKIVDQIKVATDDGKISMEAYAQSIGRVVPSAAAAKLPLEQINAAISALTAQGVPVETTFSGINQAIKTILKPTEEAKDLAKALGLEFNSQALATKGLGGFLEDVAQKTGKSSDALNILFSDIDGYKAVVGLLNDDLRRFNQFTENQALAIGRASEAARIGVDPLKQYDNAWKDFSSTLGSVVLPALTEVTKAATGMLRAVMQGTETMGNTATFRWLFNGGRPPQSNRQAQGMIGPSVPERLSRSPVRGNAMGTPIGATVGGGGAKQSAEDRAKQSAEDRIAAKPFGRQIIAAAKANSVDPALFAALVAQESNFNQRAVSRSGAIGLSQLMPGTARELGVNPRDPMQNLMGGAKYLRQQMNQFGLEGGLRAYNQGPGAQQRTPGGNSQESREYPGKVLARYKQFAGGSEGIADLTAEGVKAQADAAEKMRDQLKAAESTNVALKDQLAIAQTTEPVARQMLEYDIERNRLAREYQDLRDAAAGPDELILINANLIIEQRVKQIEHEEKLNSLIADRAVLMANVADQAAMPTVYNELETQEAALQAVLEKYPAIGAAADAAATLATSGVSEMIAGTKDAKEVFVDFLGSIADALMDTAKRMIAQYIAIGIARIFAGMGGGGGGGFAPSGDLAAVGSVGTGFKFDAGAMTGGMPWSFAGGGYTGSAPRAGGIDGQGGFPAILHPQETVIDHTRAMPVPYQRAAAAAAPPAMPVPYQRSGPTLDVPFQKPAGSQASDSMNATIDVKFETVQIGRLDCVTRDEAEQIGRESAQRGADLAHKRYRNNPSARRAAGFS